MVIHLYEIFFSLSLELRSKFMLACHSGGSRGGGFRGLEPPFFFWPINAFEWEHIVGTPLYSVLGTPSPLLKWLDPPLCYINIA